MRATGNHAAEMDALTCALIGLARASRENEERLTTDSLRLICTGLTASTEDAEWLTQEIHREKARLSPDCSSCMHPCGRTADYDMDDMLLDSEAVRKLRGEILAALRQSAAAVKFAALSDAAAVHLAAEFCRGLNMLGDYWSEAQLRDYIGQAGRLAEN